MRTAGNLERRMGAAFGMAHLGVSLCSRIILVPIILRYLSRSEFGLYQLIGSFVGYLALIDFGISDTIGRFTARYQALDDRKGQENLISMCILIYAMLAVIVAIAGACLYANLGTVFSKSLTPNELAEAKIMFAILMGSISATVLSRACVGVNAGHERFIFSRITDSVCEIGKIIVVVAVLKLGYHAIAIVGVEACINLAIMLANAAYAVFVLKIRIKIHRWDFVLFRELTGFAFWTFLAALVIQINYRFGNILLGVVTGTSLVGVYAIALQINTVYNTLPTIISNVFLPKITRMVVNQESSEELIKTIIGPSRYQFMIVGFVLGSFILFGRQFLSLWAGPDYTGAWGAALLIMVPVTIPLCQNSIHHILYAKALNRTYALIALGFAVLSGILSVFLIRPLGLYGPAIATGAAMLFGHGLVMNLYYHYGVGLNMRSFFGKLTEHILLMMILAAIIGSALRWVPVGNGWIGLGTRECLFSLIYVVLMWLFGMHGAERYFFKTSFVSGIRILMPSFGRETVKD